MVEDVEMRSRKELELPKHILKNKRCFEIDKDTIEYEKENLAMLCLVSTVVWR